jgi:acyl-[acyl carrier protein]--UDP-N-acetylglucosamine O-acyltransferase
MIHATAIVDSKAEIDSNVEIGRIVRYFSMLPLALLHSR